MSNNFKFFSCNYQSKVTKFIFKSKKLVNFVLVGFVLWRINLFRSFNAESSHFDESLFQGLYIFKYLFMVYSNFQILIFLYSLVLFMLYWLCLEIFPYRPNAFRKDIIASTFNFILGFRYSQR